MPGVSAGVVDFAMYRAHRLRKAFELFGLAPVRALQNAKIADWRLETALLFTSLVQALQDGIACIHVIVPCVGAGAAAVAGCVRLGAGRCDNKIGRASCRDRVL